MITNRLPHDKFDGASLLARRMRLASSTGYTMIEIAIVVAVIGLIAAVSIGAYSGALGGREVKTASAVGENVTGAIMAYARLYNHLPCPDTDGDGREGGATGACPAGREIGYVPYESVGLSLPPTAQRAVYGVYRNAGIGADLVAPVAGTPTRNNFLRAMANASNAAIISVSAGHVFITGDKAATGAENCAGNRVLHPAFAVVIPGSDRDGDGKTLDGINAVLPGTGQCLASPDRVPDTVFDDRVISTGFTTLLGLISTDAP